jgi:hypothetical protein
MTSTTTTDQATFAFLKAAADLMQCAFEDARRSDSAGADGLAHALRAGALATVRATLAPSTGLAQVSFDITTPAGEELSLMSVELQKEVAQ